MENSATSHESLILQFQYSIVVEKVRCLQQHFQYIRGKIWDDPKLGWMVLTQPTSSAAFKNIQQSNLGDT